MKETKKRRDWRRQWYANNREDRQAKARELYAANPRVIRGYHLKKTYGISLVEYERILISQGGACKICRRVPDGKHLAVDHDHATGRIRGLLCQQCNTVLGLLKEDLESIKRLFEYVGEEHYAGDPKRMAL